MPHFELFAPLLATSALAELGPTRRTGTKPEADLNASVQKAAEAAGLLDSKAELVRALVLLWHDHLDGAHNLVQHLGGVDAAFIHGIMHRREPDYGNAAYWFRRVGSHPAFPALAKRVGDLLEVRSDAGLRANLVSGGAWNALGFIDACERTANSPSSPQAITLRKVQQLETQVLLEHLLAN